jgi:hypothetical protein
METKLHVVTNDDIIAREDLRRLLGHIKNLRPDIHVRFRILSKPWQRNFCRLFVVNETGLVLIDEIESKVEMVPNFADIVQFEIDSRFQHYCSYTQYHVAEMISN